jgi:23S rRNA (cytidine2498-2'-O)-methyltransferase
VTAAPSAAPRPSEWLFTTRPGAEQDLIDELFFLDAECAPRLAGPSLVACARWPRRPGGVTAPPPAFARQGLYTSAIVAADAGGVARAWADAIARTAREPASWAADLWVPDADVSNPWAAQATALASEAAALVEAGLTPRDPRWAGRRVADARAAFADNGIYAQGCFVSEARVAVGAGWARDAVSLAPGGRLRVHVPDQAPSRAAQKLLEAFAWLDRAPEPNDLCVDLGASPGGWTWVLLERRARVIAVDPGALAPSVRGRRGLTHARGDAFKFVPPEPVDWLFCDMAYRPLEVAGLLARWCRNGWARLLVANVKLPMKKKAEILLRVRDILEDGGWQDVRVRQLYNDREEVTIAAVRIR